MDATQHFSMRSIKLWKSQFTRDESLDFVRLSTDDHTVQSFRGVRAHVYQRENGSEKEQVLRCLVSLGVRLVSPVESDQSEKVLYSVEATFAADFDIKDASFSQEFFEDFAQFNSIHSVWPFWREHVFSTLRQASLPLLEIPLFAGRPKASQKRSRKVAIETKSVAVEPKAKAKSRRIK